eukprot:8491976-Pyramimonas_sp.AAC.1
MTPRSAKAKKRSAAEEHDSEGREGEEEEREEAHEVEEGRQHHAGGVHNDTVLRDVFEQPHQPHNPN